MAEALTARQTLVLKSLIDEYIETAEPVGSETLDKKYNLGVSSATIRSEMVDLTKMRFLQQPHTSAGRIPTPKAMKFYISQLMEERKLSLAEEVKTKEEVWDVRQDLDELLKQATHALAERTRNLAVAAVDDGTVWHSGYANVFHNPEFADLGFCAGVFSLIEEPEFLRRTLLERISWEAPYEVVFGEELELPELSSLGIVSTPFRAFGKSGALAVVGPFRLDYAGVIPVLRHFGDLIKEVSKT